MIRAAVESGLGMVPLDGLDKANALTAEMLAQLAEKLEAARREGARALVRTGAGRVFCAGAKD